MANVFLAAFSYTAALVGAGFASGQEIVGFFVRYGKFSIFGIVFCAVMFGLFAALVMDVCVGAGTDSYDCLLSGIMPCRARRALSVLTFVFAASVVCVMSACFGETVNMLLGIRKLYGSAFLCAVCAAAICAGNAGALRLNAAIGAVMVIGVTAVCFYMLGYREHQAFSQGVSGAVSAASYSGYNLLTAGAVLAGLASFLKSRREAWLCGAAACVMMLVMMTLMWLILSIYYGKTDLGELPMLTLTARESGALAAVYGALITAAVFTTALSNGICAVSITEEYLGRGLSAVLVCGAGLAFGTAGFSRLIDTAYRYCGYAGFAAAAFVMSACVKKIKNRENKRF